MGVVLRKLPIPIYNDRVYIMVVYTGFFLPISIWIAKGFFDAIRASWKRPHTSTVAARSADSCAS